MQGLIQWGQNSSINSMPPSYTHRQMIVALKVLGAKRVLAAILEELKQQSDAGNVGVAYDVATALVCAPDVTNDAEPLLPPTIPPLDESGNVPGQPQRHMTLRQALRAEAEDWKRIQKADPARAEMVVRLYRRAEAQLIMAQPEPILEPSGLGLDVAGTSIDDAMAEAAAAVVAGVVDPVTDAGLSLDTSMDLGLGPGDLNLGSAGDSAGGLNLADDYFGDLPGAGDFNLDHWGDIDLV
jgi:mediator of RNA polymerase II transcription subunit 5